MSALENNSGD